MSTTFRLASDAGARSALQVLDRAFSVLGLFTTQRPEWTVSEVALALGLPLTTTHRILGVLLQHAFLGRDSSTKRFRLGVAALELGARSRATLDPTIVFLDALRDLAEATGETAMLCTLDSYGEASFCVDRIESSQPLRLSVQPGRTIPLHAGAMSKALLAFLPTDQLEAVLERPLEKLCTRTITKPGQLRAELSEIRARGYATSFEETNVGVWGVAVPILDARGYSYASVGTAGPLVRFAPEHLERKLKRCNDTAAKIAEALGLAVWSPSNTEGPRRGERAAV